MSTRGTFGFRVNGEDKLMYNDCDSYPAGLGSDVIQFIKGTSDERLKEIALGIIPINTSIPPTAEQKQMVKDFEELHSVEISNLNVSNKSLDDWYCLLRGAQGRLDFYKMGFPFAQINNTFAYESLFCEWGYVINIDSKCLEVYKGFNKNPDAKGRYAKLGKSVGYYGIELVVEYTFDEVRNKINSIDIEQ